MKKLVIRKLRCAVYTRKSSEEGLDMEFNSLDAQREACEAYVRSQAGEGWTALPQFYDDGGYSGGNLDRPAIRQLLDDVDRGNVDVIVVYKVDRLTRSLADFAKIVERLDARGVSFVSVTQQFNTTSSMGRLTLNVLLSFAQFEREVTGERIRDKIAASKAKGIWMGGNVPLGYDLGERRLVVNRTEANLVRHLFARYAELQSGVEVVRELRSEGVVTKRWTSRTGQVRGGIPFSCGALYYILQNRLYIGEVVHRGFQHTGEHDPIIDPELFDQVQQALAANRRKRGARVPRTAECQLAGLVHHGTRGPMTTSFSYGRGGRLYRYYVAGSLDPARPRGPDAPLRVAAAPLERLVLGCLVKLRDSPIAWNEALSLIQRIELWDRSIQLVLRTEAFADPHEDPHALLCRLQTSAAEDRVVMTVDGELRMIADRSATFRGGKRSVLNARSDCSESLRLRHLVRTAHKMLAQFNMSPLSPDAHNRAVAPTDQRRRRLMSIGLLSPSVQRKLLETGASCSFDAWQSETLPLAWCDQVRLVK